MCVREANKKQGALSLLMNEQLIPQRKRQTIVIFPSTGNYTQNLRQENNVPKESDSLVILLSGGMDVFLIWFEFAHSNNSVSVVGYRLSRQCPTPTTVHIDVVLDEDRNRTVLPTDWMKCNTLFWSWTISDYLSYGYRYTELQNNKLGTAITSWLSFKLNN